MTGAARIGNQKPSGGPVLKARTYLYRIPDEDEMQQEFFFQKFETVLGSVVERGMRVSSTNDGEASAQHSGVPDPASGKGLSQASSWTLGPGEHTPGRARRAIAGYSADLD